MISDIVLAATLLAGVSGQQPADSTKVTELDEVSVEAVNQKATNEKIVYHPTKQQKKFAMNGVQLLSMMGIPQIRAELGGSSVTTNSGQSVSLFINHMPADKSDIDGIKMEDVIDVEYLTSPDDPRYRGAMYAINFVVRIPEYGGYTKLTGQWNVNSPFQNNEWLYSKFAYKKMIYDIYASVSNISMKGAGVSNFERFSFPDSQGEEMTCFRNEIFDGSTGHNNIYPVSFRASYLTDRLQVRNSVGYTYSDFLTDSRGHLEIQDRTLSLLPYRRRTGRRNNSLSYNGNMFLSMNRGWRLNLDLAAYYSHNDNDNEYFSTLTDETGIIRDAKEDSYQLEGTVNVGKQIGIHNISADFKIKDYNSRVNYLVPFCRDRYEAVSWNGDINYSASLNKVRLYLSAGWRWERNEINGIRSTKSYPGTYVNLSWSPSAKHHTNLVFAYKTFFPDENSRTDNVFQSNEFLWSTGNPGIKSSDEITTNLSYTWLPLNTFYLSATYYNVCAFNRLNTVYTPYEGNGVISKIVNNGDYYYNALMLTATLRLLSNRLQLSVSPAFNMVKTTGINSESLNYPSGYLSGAYYLKDFFISVYHIMAFKSYNYGSGLLNRDCASYGVNLGWGKASWRIQASVNNIFRKRGRMKTTWFESPVYSRQQVSYAPGTRNVVLTVQYTFDYGKKINRGDEVGKMNGAASGIF